MSCICIGGLCIPYTAVLPFLAVIAKWFLQKWRSFFGAANPNSSTGKSSCCQNGVCSMPPAASAKSPIPKASRKSNENILTIESMEEYEKIYKKGDETNIVTVIDFTASWCGPCKAIAPFFAKLCDSYDAHFVKVDVDELDELAMKCEVSCMPTFVVIEKGKVVDRTSGANEAELETMVKKWAVRVI